MELYPIKVIKSDEQILYICANSPHDAIEQVNKQIQNKELKWESHFKLNGDRYVSKDPVYDISILEDQKINGEVNNIKGLYTFSSTMYKERRNILIDVDKNTFIVLDEGLEDPTLDPEEEEETFELRFPLNGDIVINDSIWKVKCTEIERYKKYSYEIVTK